MFFCFVFLLVFLFSIVLFSCLPGTDGEVIVWLVGGLIGVLGLALLAISAASTEHY